MNIQLTEFQYNRPMIANSYREKDCERGGQRRSALSQSNSHRASCAKAHMW
jgi:hypothetical protein